MLGVDPLVDLKAAALAGDLASQPGALRVAGGDRCQAVGLVDQQVPRRDIACGQQLLLARVGVLGAGIDLATSIRSSMRASSTSVTT